jgi:hypothetical protein
VPVGHLSAPSVFLGKLPLAGPIFLGREAELKLLNDAWADAGRTHVVEMVAWGGVGKTSLVKRWLDRLRGDGWRGAQRVYGWSFFSQGTSDDRQASDDSFLNDALRWFGVEHDSKFSPWDKGRLLAEAIAGNRTLLVLDGLEPLQYPPGPLGGQLRTPGVQALLRGLAAAGQPGLCVITTRESIKDLEEYERTQDHPTGAVLKHDLGNLNDTDGARLLHRLGVRRAGTAAIGEDDTELRAAGHEVHGHALTLTLLGRYLALAHGGNIHKRGLVRFEEADEEKGGHAFRAMDAYVAWFKTSQQNRPLMAVLRLLGLFDRPADAGCLAALHKSPAITGLTEPLVNLTQAQWNLALSRLAECGLISLPERASNNSSPTINHSQSLDTHPLIREYFAKQLREQNPQAWRAAHRRLYEHLKASVPYRPESFDGLQQLYQAVAHGCKAGLYQEAYDEVYCDRILRGTWYDGFYSTRKLGAFGADLGAVSCFFEEPWKRLAPVLSEATQASLLNQAAYRLRALGRLTESLEPMQLCGEMVVQRNDWQAAATSYSNLSELKLSLGQVAAALRAAEQSVAFADNIPGDSEKFIITSTTLADAEHQAGRRSEAFARFHKAEALQAQAEPLFPLLYSVQGFQYCDLLLSDAERTAWATWLAPSLAAGADGRKPTLQALRELEQRVVKMFEWRMPQEPLLDVALDHLTLGRAALYRAVLESGGGGTATTMDTARRELTAAMDGLRAAGHQDHLPRGLLSRAWLRFVEGDANGARADLNEAWQIAERGPMRLFMADIHLHCARLFRDRAALVQARQLIEHCGYGRRKEELEDAERALDGQRS